MTRALTRLSVFISIFIAAVFAGFQVVSPNHKPKLDVFVLESPSDNFRLSQVMAAPAQSWTKVATTRLYSIRPRSNLWVKIEIPPLPNAATNWLLRAQHPIAEHLDFFLITHTAILNQHSYNLESPDSQACTWNCDLDFRFTQKSNLPRTLYINARSQGFLSLPFGLHQDGDFESLNLDEFSLWGVYFGCMLGLLTYHLLKFARVRNPLHFYFIIVQVSLLLASMELAGFGLIFHNWSILTHTSKIKLTILLVSAYQVALHVLMQHLTDQNLVKLPNLPQGRELLIVVVATSGLVYFLPIFPGFYIWIGVIIAINIHEITKIWQLSELRISRFAAAGLIGHFICAGITFLCYSGLLPAFTPLQNLVYFGMAWQSACLAISISNSLRLHEDQQRQIFQALSDAGSPPTPTLPLAKQLENLVSQIKKPREVEISILFVYIGGFRDMLAKSNTATAFDQLASRLSLIKEIIALHGGTVDRSIGEGLMCIFGGHLSAKDQNHANSAFQAACALQKTVSAKDFEAAADPSLIPRDVLPLQIGIHSDTAILGNVGDRIHLDFTIISPGLSYASALAHACAPMRILMSSDSRDRIHDAGIQNAAMPIYITLNHYDDLIKVFEFDPLSEQTASVDWISRRYLDQRGYKRIDQRSPVAQKRKIALSLDKDVFDVLDISPFGMRVISQIALGTNTRIQVKISTDDEEINNVLREKLLSHVFMEVRWSRRTQTGIEHGLKLSGLSNLQRTILFAMLRVFLAETLVTKAV